MAEKRKKRKFKKKNGLLGVGLSVALLSTISSGLLAYGYTQTNKNNNENEINLDTQEDDDSNDLNISVENNNSKLEENLNNTEIKKEESPKEEVKLDKPSYQETKPTIESKDENKELENLQITTPTQINPLITNLTSSNTNQIGKVFVVNRFDVAKMLNGTYSGPLSDKKTIFLTFDDGPSKNTGKILDVLKNKNVHGTFFVLGEQVKSGANYIKRIYDEGNAIGNHSYTHNFKTLYPNNSINIINYMNEYYQTENALKNILGDNFNTGLVRMPGGENSREYYKDPNLSPLKNKFKSEGIASIDWNSLNGDAEGKKYSTSEMVEYVKKTSKNKKQVIILMHDSASKGLTVDALPQIIDYFKGQGYEFKTIG